MSNLIENLHNILKNIDHNMDDDSTNKFISYYLWKECGIGECPTGPYVDGFNELVRFVEMIYAEQVQRTSQMNG